MPAFTNTDPLLDNNVRYLKLVFDTHQSDPSISKAMNSTYSDNIPRFGELFTDDNRDELIPSDELSSVIRHIIANDMIAAHARHTADKTIILPIINKASLFIVVEDIDGHRTHSRLNSDTLTRQMNRAQDDTVIIKININFLIHDYDIQDLDVLDWSTFQDSPKTRTHPLQVSQPPSAADIATAVASAIPPPAPAPTVVDIAKALATAIPGPSPAPDPTVWATAFSNAISPLIGTSGGSSSGSGPTTAALAGYNYTHSASLPSDVRQRYDDFMANKLCPGSLTRTPYATGNFYYDELSHIFLANGQLYFSNRLEDEKSMMKLDCTCKETTPAEIREWYKRLTKSLLAYGFYVHPLWNFRANHGGPRGFTVGSGPDDDLPDRFMVPLSKQSGPIFQFLTRTNMFPKDSRLPSVVLSAKGDGHVALCSIIRIVHPAFHKIPSDFVGPFPQQKGQPFQTYFNRCCDFQEMRANVYDEVRDFDNPHEVDMLLTYSDYSEYLHRVTRDERRQLSFKDRYTKDQLLQTIQTHLTAGDSPTLLDRPQRQRAAIRQPAHLQPLDTMRHTNVVQEDEYESEYSMEPDIEEERLGEQELDSLRETIPEEEQEFFHDYRATVHAIRATPSIAFKAKCIVCGEEHNFDRCPVLKNHEHLKSHYIRYCQMLKRDRYDLDRQAGPSRGGRGGRGFQRDERQGPRQGTHPPSREPGCAHRRDFNSSRPRQHQQVQFVDIDQDTDAYNRYEDFHLGRI